MAAFRSSGVQRPESAAFALFWTAVFCVVLSALHVQHEGWRDELHCWALARDADGLVDLLFGKRKYDGHPFLWYYILHLASRLTRDVVALHVVAIAIQTCAAFLWLRYSNLPRVLRASAIFSHLLLYEYGVISRGYGLGVLLVFAFAAVYRPDRVRYRTLASLLALLMVTSAYGAVLAAALGFFLLLRGFRLGWPRKGDWRIICAERGAWSGAVIFGLGAAFSAYTTLPPSDALFAPTVNTSLSAANLQAALSSFWWAHLPWGESWWWGESLGQAVVSVAPFLPWLSAALFALFLLAFRKEPRVLLAYAAGVIAIALFQQMKYSGGMRHVGHFVVLLLACAWLFNTQRRGRSGSRLLWTLLGLVLIVQVRTGVLLAWADWKRPFSGAKATAMFIRDNVEPDAPVIGSVDFLTLAVAGYLDRGIFFAEAGDFGGHIVAHNRRTWVTPASLVALAQQKLHNKEAVILVTSYPLPVAPGDGVKLELLYQSPEAPIVADERFWVTRVSRPGSP